MLNMEEQLLFKWLKNSHENNREQREQMNIFKVMKVKLSTQSSIPS